jgi:hypothetical protein
MVKLAREETKTLLMLVLHYGTDWHNWNDRRYAETIHAHTFHALYNAGYVEYRSALPREAKVTPEGLRYLQEVEHGNANI